MHDAVVVGSGPNGLAAAVELARSGLSVTVLEGSDEIGGGTRTRELTLPGVSHDVCSAVHPFGIASPYFRSLPLEAHGLRWAHAPIELAHPLDEGRAGIIVRSLDATATGLGADGDSWRRLMGPLAERFDDLIAELQQPIVHVPAGRRVGSLLRFGTRALLPATRVAHRWSTDEARALFAGMAAHSFAPLTNPATAAVGLLFGASAHSHGWPVAVGGSRAITDALASLLAEHGGTIETGVMVRSATDIPESRVTLLDLAPRHALDVVGTDLAPSVRRGLERWRHGPAAFKVDLAVEGGVPWTNEACSRAGTVHVGGTMEELVAAEADVSAGRMPDRPLVLVAQQYVADPSRSNGNIHPVWSYAHVPAGFDSDATGAVLAQIERFAPGIGDRIVGVVSTAPRELEAYNPSYIGGDIAHGSSRGRQMLFRPRIALDPYRLTDRTFLCSAATPPGAGVHGMCGYHAARRALRSLGVDGRVQRPSHGGPE
ncbi:MAG TPA: NAD(P)/FAD-dependent oxidoreductase [Acidimicrobiales bacterium]